MDQAARQGLKAIIREKSYREGDFTLVSGKKSKFYVDLKATTLSVDGAYYIGKLIADEIRAQGWSAAQGVGGLTLGADPIATAVSLASRATGEKWPAFIVRKEPKSHGTSRWVEGTENLPPRAKVVVVEDVATTGGSSIKAVERLRESGYEPIGVVTIIDREEGASEAFHKLGIPFTSLFKLSEIQAG